MNRIRKHLRIALTSGWILAAVPACSSLAPADPDQARATLSEALDAWREGKDMDDLTGGNPPITVSEPKWKAGYKLTSYQVGESARAIGLDLKIPVELSLQDPKGKATREKVRYTVSVQPARTVIRSPL